MCSSFILERFRLLHAIVTGGADVNARNVLGGALLHAAAGGGHLGAAALLIHKKVW
jgi:hypothetical protein